MKTNWKPMVVFVGIVLIAGGVIALALDPTITDQYTKPGSYVMFGVKIDRPALPEMMEFSAQEVQGGCPRLLSIVSTLDTKVEIKLQEYKILTTTQVTTVPNSQVAWIYACEFIPNGVYLVTYTSYNRGGELCVFGCNWEIYKIVTKTLTVTDTGVSIA